MIWSHTEIRELRIYKPAYHPVLMAMLTCSHGWGVMNECPSTSDLMTYSILFFSARFLPIVFCLFLSFSFLIAFSSLSLLLFFLFRFSSLSCSLPFPSPSSSSLSLSLSLSRSLSLSLSLYLSLSPALLIIITEKNEGLTSKISHNFQTGLWTRTWTRIKFASTSVRALTLDKFINILHTSSILLSRKRRILTFIYLQGVH